MRSATVLVSVALAVASGGCRAPGANRGDVPAMTASGVVMRRPDANTVLPRCPPAATGARTDVQDIPNGVVIDVTGDDEATSDDIRARTKAMIAIVDRAKEGIEHTGDGDGPGLGRCPVVLHDATISATPIDLGMRIVVVTNADEADWLRKEPRERMIELRAPQSSHGLGMDHCPSALPSATTDVRDSDEGVIVTVLSRDPDVAEAIRARAWHVTQEAHHAGMHGEHAPLASRVHACPVVLTDTVVEARDVPGGSEIRVRPRIASELADVRKAAHERAQAFR